MKQYSVYITANQHRRVLYTGCTSNLEQRIAQHKTGTFSGFSKKYHCHVLVYAEECPDADSMVRREQHIKGWTRAKKEALIATINPMWEDLANPYTTDPFDGGHAWPPLRMTPLLSVWAPTANLTRPPSS